MRKPDIVKECQENYAHHKKARLFDEMKNNEFKRSSFYDHYFLTKRRCQRKECNVS